MHNVLVLTIRVHFLVQIICDWTDYGNQFITVLFDTTVVINFIFIESRMKKLVVIVEDQLLKKLQSMFLK